jgi:Amt family ammonium transporter
MPKTTGNGLFFGGGLTLLKAQAIGVVAAGVFTFAISLAGWALIKMIMGLRVSPEEELEGLDYGEHGMTAYPDFQLVTTSLGTGRPASTAGYQMAAVAVPKKAPAHQ